MSKLEFGNKLIELGDGSVCNIEDTLYFKMKFVEKDERDPSSFSFYNIDIDRKLSNTEWHTQHVVAYIDENVAKQKFNELKDSLRKEGLLLGWMPCSNDEKKACRQDIDNNYERVKSIEADDDMYFARIIRCKDCSYRRTADCLMIDPYDVNSLDWTIDDGFCYKGESGY